jgi:hypothetical protein
MLVTLDLNRLSAYAREEIARWPAAERSALLGRLIELGLSTLIQNGVWDTTYLPTSSTPQTMKRCLSDTTVTSDTVVWRAPENAVAPAQCSDMMKHATSLPPPSKYQVAHRWVWMAADSFV